jgi:hypothetical protein
MRLAQFPQQQPLKTTNTDFAEWHPCLQLIARRKGCTFPWYRAALSAQFYFVTDFTNAESRLSPLSTTTPTDMTRDTSAR